MEDGKKTVAEEESLDEVVGLPIPKPTESPLLKPKLIPLERPRPIELPKDNPRDKALFSGSIASMVAAWT